MYACRQLKEPGQATKGREQEEADCSSSSPLRRVGYSAGPGMSASRYVHGPFLI
jgi:hypothetical protein